MKHQYVGDVTDYVKYGLIRALGNAGLGTALHWMLTPADRRTDGSRTSYLHDRERWRRHDPELFDALHAIVIGLGERDLAAIEASGLLPRCRFFSEPVPRDPAARRAGFGRFLAAACGADVALFDPDNGLQVPSVPPGAPGSPRYLLEDEVRRAWGAGLSLIVFQFFPREARRAFVRRIARRLRDLTGAERVTVLQATHTVYLGLPQAHHAERWSRALRAIRGDWADALAIRELRSRSAGRPAAAGAAPQPRGPGRATARSRRSSAVPRG